MKLKTLKINLILKFGFLLVWSWCSWAEAKIVFPTSQNLESRQNLKVATWNIRQASMSKMQNLVVRNGTPVKILDFLGDWYSDRGIDILAIQEFQERTDLTSGLVESPMHSLLSRMPAGVEVIKGQPIREPTLRGLASQWEDYCPIFFNARKLICTAASDSAFKIGYDYALGPQSELIYSVQTPRFINWAYCEAKDASFDFVVSCVHINYKTAEPQILGVPELIHQIQTEAIDVPYRLRLRNQDYIFAGDFNLDRRSAKVFDSWGTEASRIDKSLPVFPPKSRWEKKAFTKLKDIYTFSEARLRSKDIYDDVTHTESMNESLVHKFVDPLIDEYFINPNTNRVDMRSLLRLSDHLPVIATYDLTTDSD